MPQPLPQFAQVFSPTADSAGLHPPCDLAEFVESVVRSHHGGRRRTPQDSTIDVELVDDKVITELRDALNWMASDERGLWVRMGMALKTLGEIVGLGLWLTWSQKSIKFDTASAMETWRGLKPTSTGHKAVFAEAKRWGWVNPLSNTATNHHAIQPTVGDEPTFNNAIFVQAGDLVREPAPVEYLIDELIEHPCLMMLFGAPSAGKSFVALSWAASIACGHNWLGRDVHQGSVFYLAGEGHAGLGRRLRAWQLDTGRSIADAPLYVSKLPAALMDPANAALIEQAINTLAAQHGAPALVVIDTLARNMGSGDENSNADISQFISRVDGLRLRLGCTVALVHHSGHMESDRARGASALPAAMDAIFQMEHKGKVRKLVQQKAKESEIAAPIELFLREVPIGWPDAKGREMSSAVLKLVEQEEDAPWQRKKPLNVRQLAALQSFFQAVFEVGVEGDGVASVELDGWRPYFNKACGAKGGADAKRKAFQRAREELVDLGELMVDADTYSIPDDDPTFVGARSFARMTGQPDKAGQTA